MLVFLCLSVGGAGGAAAASGTLSGEDTTAWSNPVMSWRYEAYTADQLKIVYWVLHKEGYFISNAVTADLTRPDLVSYIKRYQERLGVAPTGFLTPMQMSDLLAASKAPSIRASVKALGLDPRKRKPRDALARHRADWQERGYSQEQKKQLYRALYQLRLVNSAEMVTDFSYRLNLIESVRAYQGRIRAERTGFLSAKQVKTLLAVNAPPLPSEQQAALFEAYGSSSVLSFIKDLGRQEFGSDPTVPDVVRKLQARFAQSEHGYVTPELFEAARAVPLQANRSKHFPRVLLFDFEDLSVFKDWSLWRKVDKSECEATTLSIHEDGFTGSALASSFSLYRGSDWDYNAVNADVQLMNLKGDNVFDLRVRGRSFFLRLRRGRLQLVTRDGDILKSPGKTYSDLIDSLQRANGFEITYDTVFDTRVVASFSAMGLTRQLKGLFKAC